MVPNDQQKLRQNAVLLSVRMSCKWYGTRSLTTMSDYRMRLLRTDFSQKMGNWRGMKWKDVQFVHVWNVKTQGTKVQIHSKLTTVQRLDKTYMLKLAVLTQTTGISIPFALSIVSWNSLPSWAWCWRHPNAGQSRSPQVRSLPSERRKIQQKHKHWLVIWSTNITHKTPLSPRLLIEQARLINTTQSNCILQWMKWRSLVNSREFFGIDCVEVHWSNAWRCQK